ncbi:hypothetical protein HZU75_13710 [Chitinibacter fontanus]|uniref:Uncharacterized protein n=1 Tax=Chitinibacter fontanus TaxID=1737446 RepID=A0A7D5VB72_9NEIS|nr:hypothetical protein [Chitinibacter fontanus]QLI82498.1 hypothetical protein HZU75_13710 [Chitinibacter fontanus]
MTVMGTHWVTVDAKFARTAILAVLDYEIEHFDANAVSFPEELALCAVEAANAVAQNDPDKVEAIVLFLKQGTPTGFKRNRDELVALRQAIADDANAHYQLEYNPEWLQLSHGSAFGTAALKELRAANTIEITNVMTIHSHWDLPETYSTILYQHRDKPEVLRILGNFATAE